MYFWVWRPLGQSIDATRPRYVTFASVMLYRDGHARGMDTVPCGIDKLESSAETMQQVSEKCGIICDAIDVQKADASVPIWASSNSGKSNNNNSNSLLKSH